MLGLPPRVAGRSVRSRIDIRVKLPPTFYSSAAIDDADHMVFDCSALESHRWNHPSLFTTRGSRSLSDFMDQDPTEVAAFVSECKKSCLALDE